jgi:hypothetical protein
VQILPWWNAMTRMKKLNADAVGITELLCSELWSNAPTYKPESWRVVAEWLRSAGTDALNKAAVCNDAPLSVSDQTPSEQTSKQEKA